MQKRFQTVLWVIVVVGIAGGLFGAGIFIGYSQAPALTRITGIDHTDTDIPVDFELFWEAWGVFEEKHIASETISKEDRVWGAIEGLAGSFNDPYTTFFPPQNAELFEETINGSFGGVGMEIGVQDNLVVVISPLKESPAEEAGIRAGDVIFAVDGNTVFDKTLDDVIGEIRGEVGTSITLTLIREGRDEAFDITVVRDVITVPTLETELREDGIFVIQLFNFSGLAPYLFQEAMRDFVLSGSDKLILDLRSNPGGFLEGAIDIASWFIPLGDVVVREEFKDPAHNRIHRSHGQNIFGGEQHMVVLVDGGSASASEIVAGALKEQGRATVIGTTTFGKGSVQELVDIGDAAARVTVAKWKTPAGTSISDGGLEPDIEVMITADDIGSGDDPQMERAVTFLLEGE